MSQRRKIRRLPNQSDDEDDDVVIIGISSSSQKQVLDAKCSRRSALANKDYEDKKDRILSSKIQAGWISSSFGGFESSALSEVKINKNKRKNESRQFSATGGNSLERFPAQEEVLWLDKYKPKSEAELSVHKKKVAEVRDWLLTHLCQKVHGPGKGAILLLTGPAGAGKTATVEVLSQEIGFEIQEWINPVANVPFEATGSEGYQQSLFTAFESQVKQFQDFLLRANKYPTLPIFGANTAETRQKIILIEDLPNIFIRDPTKLHEILRVYQQTGRSPVVFIISDNHHGDSNVYRLMPKDLQSALQIHTVSFNPVAHTSLVKAINRIVSLETYKGATSFSHPSKEVIEELSHSSAGDIRAAINALQFTCLKDKYSKTKKRQALTKTSKTSNVMKPSKKNKPSDCKASKSRCLVYGKDSSATEQLDTQTPIGGKDDSLFLFRALGKILYCKRDASLSDKDTLPDHLNSMARNQLQFSPEEVIEKTHLAGETFNLYLHQNYLLFFSDIDNVCIASDYLSDADRMTSEWMHRLTLQEYPACIAARGLAFSNTRTSAVSGGWRPLHKPQSFDVFKRMRGNCSAVRDLFQGYGSSPVVMQTEVLPYLALTDLPLKTPGQISFLQTVCRLTTRRRGFRSSTETLDERDFGGNDDNVPGSQEQGASSRREPAEVTWAWRGSAEDSTTRRLGKSEEQISEAYEEDVIEDFDDDG